jgi:hypothetical protein
MHKLCHKLGDYLSIGRRKPRTNAALNVNVAKNAIARLINLVGNEVPTHQYYVTAIDVEFDWRGIEILYELPSM